MKVDPYKQVDRSPQRERPARERLGRAAPHLRTISPHRVTDEDHVVILVHVTTGKME